MPEYVYRRGKTGEREHEVGDKCVSFTLCAKIFIGPEEMVSNNN